MRSLFGQLWLAFLAVMLLTFASALAVTYGLALRRAGAAERLSPQALAISAQSVLTNRGREGLNGWLVAEAHHQPEVQVFFVDGAGHELMSRRVHGAALRQEAGRAPPMVTAPDGATYRVLVRRTRQVAFDLKNTLLSPWFVLPLAALVSALGCAWLAWRLTRPILRLRAGVRAVAGGDLGVRLAPRMTRRGDEIGGLARDFNRMTADLAALIASKEELLRDVSHELRSPLARLRVAADLARRSGGDDAFDRIGREVERLDAMIGQILRFSRLTSGPVAEPTSALDLAEILEETTEDARLEGAAHGLDIRLTCDGPAFVLGERETLRSALENVMRNGVRHAPAGSTLDARLLRGAQEFRIEICDAGPGLAPADLERVFEPFQRAGGGDGVGLGLAITRRVIETHGGRVSARNLAGGGLCVEIVLPRGLPPVQTTVAGRRKRMPARATTGDTLLK